MKPCWNAKIFLLVALVVAALAWLIGIVANPEGVQRKVAVSGDFIGDFVDYANARGHAGCSDAYFGEVRNGIRALDRPYLPLSYDLFRLFSRNVRRGGVAFAIASSTVFVLAFLVLLYRTGVPTPQMLALVFAAALSSPLLAAVSNANTIPLAAAGVMLWAALRNARSPWLRSVAIAALAFATTLKITPAVFALCYLKERQFRDFIAFAIAATILAIVPFFWYGGVDGFFAWFANARANSGYYGSKCAWGVVPIDRTIRVLGGMSAYDTLDWPTLGAGRFVNVVVGFACLVAAFLWDGRGRYFRYMMLVGAMLLIPGNMHFYTGLYLFVPFALWMEESFGEGLSATCDSPTRKLVNSLAAFCWFLIFSPFQIPLGPGCVNHPLANVAFMGLLALQFVGWRWRRG